MADIETASFAITGTGAVDEGNAAALLDDYLPQKIGAVYRPERIPRSNAALSAVVDFLESPDILGPKGTVPSSDLLADLLKRRDGETKDARVELIYLWPDEPTDDDKALVVAARDAGIRVVSITDAVDDLTWEPEKPAEEEPAAEPEAEQVVTEVPGSAVQLLGGQLGHALELAIRAIVRDELAKATGAPTGDAPPFEGPYKPAGTVFQAPPSAPAGDADDGTEKFAFYVNEDGRYRKAKTRPRKNETRVNLTQAEIDDLGQKGLIDEK